MLTNPAYNRAGLVRATIDGVPVDLPANHPLVVEHLAADGQITAYAPSAEVVIAAIKAEAGRRINAIAPEHTQRNLTARAAELALTYPGLGFDDLPEPEKTEAAAGRAIWDQIKAIRLASNAIEATVAGMTSGQRLAFDATDDAHWE